MNLLAISASASPNSGNYYLLTAIAEFCKEEHHVELVQGLYDFDLFTPNRLKEETPQNIQRLKDKIKGADAVIISTPEYTQNIPAVLKNLIEWCTASGEFSNKKTVVITFTPHEPRGEHAMASLIASLKAMDAKVLAQFPMYKTDVEVLDHEIKLNAEQKEMMQAILEMI